MPRRQYPDEGTPTVRAAASMDALFPSDATIEGPSSWTPVADALLRAHTKRLRLEDGSQLFVHAFACVGKGDVVRADLSGEVWVRAGKVSVPVLPCYREEFRHAVAAGMTLTLVATELSSDEDFAAYHALSQFHYRTEKSFGRRSVLLLQTTDGRFPKNIGFVEITTPFLHLRNRNVVFDAPFAEPGQGVSWTAWDLPTRSKYVNAIARVSRIVVHPELRGLGLSRPLLDAAASYASRRWHVGGLRPLFLEITADMLKFMPFVSGTALRFIGESQGNAGRLAKDMAYLARARDGAGASTHAVLSGRGKGILRRQKRDIAMVTRLRDELAPTESVAEFVQGLLSSEDVDERAGELLLPLLRHPKPTYVRGLTPAAEAFLTRRTAELHLAQDPVAIPDIAPYSGQLVVEDLTVDYDIDTGELTTLESGAIRRAFGLDRTFTFRTGINQLSLQVRPGQVCYLYGASGSGKTTLLRLMMGTRPPARLEGSVRLPSGVRIGLLEPVPPGAPLISAIRARGLAEAVYALNSSGLSEPRLYLTPFEKLSTGQQYRASLARLICSGANVWLLDEFAAGLDDATAVAVGRNFVRAARQLGVILVAATVRRQPLVNAMAPDVVVHLTQLEAPVVTRRWREWAGVAE
jgi:ABC-type transport system involved in cytochrome c biogenesis ATPase subunit/GNAT superfamily N-acetyltransferase